MLNQVVAPSTKPMTAFASISEPRSSANFFQRRAHTAKSLFKFIGALRGQGNLDVSGIAFPVDYQIDAFSAGAVRMATGGLEGEFGSWPGIADAASGASGVLRLENGTKLAVTIVGSADGQLEVDLVCNAVLMNQMVSQRSH